MTPFRPRWLPGALVAAATFAVFLPALGGGFVNWDDDENFLWNPHYRGLGWREIRWMFTAVHQGLYIPVTWLTLGLDHVVWGMNPFGYHLTSVALHAANAALFYAVASRLLGAAFPGRTEGRSLGAAAAALVFSVHPLRVESVAWVTERRDVVVGLLGLLTVLAYLAAWRRGAEGRLAWGWYGAAVLCFGLALLAKSIVVCLPLVLLALDLYPLSRSAPLARLALEKLPFLALSAGIAALTVAILVDRDLLASRETLGVAARLALAAYGLAFYAGKTLVPGPLSPIYPLIQPVTPWTLTYLAPAAVVILVTAGVILARRRWPAGCVIWGSYVALVAPVLGLLHSGPQIAADRYSYLACMPFALLAGAGLTWVRRRAAERQIAPLVGWAALAGAAGFLVVLSGLTTAQARVWRDSVTLWEHATAVRPESDIPVFYLGWALADVGRLDEARDHFTRSLARAPESLPELRAQLLVHRGIIEGRAGRLAASRDDFARALALDPRHPVALVRLASVTATQGDDRRAKGLFARAVALASEWPRYPIWEIRAAIADVPRQETSARVDLGLALGLLLQSRRALEPAAEQYRLILDLDPRQPVVWNNLGVIYAQQRRYTEALDAFAEALRVEPSHREACRNGLLAARQVAGRRPELDRCRETQS